MSAGELIVGSVALVRMTPLLDVTLGGDPLGKPRHRTGRAGAQAIHYADPKGESWEKAAAYLFIESMRRKPRFAIPLVLYVCAVKTRPAVLRHKAESQDRILRDQKPDGDNVLKAVADALQLAGMVDDDKRIVAKGVDSWWAAAGEEPSVRVVLGLPPSDVACRVRPAG